MMINLGIAQIGIYLWQAMIEKTERRRKRQTKNEKKAGSLTPFIQDNDQT